MMIWYSTVFFAFFSIWFPARPPPRAPRIVATSLPRPPPTWWPMTPPTTAPPTAPAPDPVPAFSTSRTSSTTAHSRQIAATTTGGGGGTAARAATCGGSDLATGLGFTAGLCSAGFASSFFFKDTATTEIYTLSLHDALPISGAQAASTPASSEGTTSTPATTSTDRKSTRLNSSHMSISYAVFCLKKKNI